MLDEDRRVTYPLGEETFNLKVSTIYSILKDHLHVQNFFVFECHIQDSTYKMVPENAKNV